MYKRQLHALSPRPHRTWERNNSRIGRLYQDCLLYTSCRNVLIRNNRFINALTNMFQFTEAVISIYPEIPDLEHQKKYFHGGKGEKGVVIEDNYFETFDRPVLFAKSIDGLVFKNNVIRQNTDYPAFHHNKTRFRLLHTRNVKIEKNNFEDGDESVVRE